MYGEDGSSKCAEVVAIGETKQTIWNRGVKSEVVSTVSIARSIKTTQHLPREGDVAELTFTSAMPVEPELIDLVCR